MSNIHFFGVRHLSPSAAYHLLEFLERHQPKCLLIEGPADATPLMPQMVQKGVKTPIAMLGYTTELPIETVLYPFADYSPEYQAICWAVKKKATLRFIDLPTQQMLKLRQEQSSDEAQQKAQDFYRYHNTLYKRVAEQAGETDYEDYWERQFEHNLTADAFAPTLAVQSGEMREMVIGKEYEEAPFDFSYNLLREAFMKREIEKARAEFKPNEIVAVVGAYHLSGLQSDLAPMTDAELQQLPQAASQLTLMPYSYLRLSSRTGYGAGNRAPYYFELMWRAIQNNQMDDLAATYLTKVAKILRTQGENASSASVIEAVRLANVLSAMKGGSHPVLEDLHDAVVTCFGAGDLAVVAEAINKVDIGTAIGALPDGVSQTPVQEDMRQALKRLKLSAYQSAVAQDLSLDLRENLKVKTKEAAFIDLNRSTFFHRLQVLGIHFATEQSVSQEKASWAEKWVLQWTPEVEIEIVEANLKGETLEIATAFVLKEQLGECQDISVVARIIRQACECQLTDIFSNALSTLQRLLVETTNFAETANAALQLSVLIQYGDLRQFNLEPLKPLLQQLFLRASLLLLDASYCDEKASKPVLEAINTMERIGDQQYDLVDLDTWHQQLIQLAWHDDVNSKLSGIAFAILLEHNLATEEECGREVSRRLSAGVPADLGASWFEGFSGRNRYALLSRTIIWQELDQYIRQLDEEQFMRSVVFLRRAFSSFEPNQKNSIAELLGDLWGTGKEATAELLQETLSEAETTQLEELNDFDFDF